MNLTKLISSMLSLIVILVCATIVEGGGRSDPDYKPLRGRFGDNENGDQEALSKLISLTFQDIADQW